MNKVILMGRLTRDPEIRYSQSDNPICIARYTLAVDRRVKRQGEETADFIRCVAFGRSAEFAEKYLHKGSKIAVVGRITTGSYVNQSNERVYTTEVTVEEQHFAESKAAADAEWQKDHSQPQAQAQARTEPQGGFVPAGDEELPFS